jgi:hypothetical protein
MGVSCSLVAEGGLVPARGQLMWSVIRCNRCARISDNAQLYLERQSMPLGDGLAASQLKEGGCRQIVITIHKNSLASN